MKSLRRILQFARYNSSNEFIQKFPTSKEPQVPFASPFPFLKPKKRTNESLEHKKARLVYSSRKRGILETDLLLSSFFHKRLESFGMDELEQYDELLNENDWDIFYWAIGARNVPERIEKMVFWEDLVEHCKNKEKQIVKMPTL
ncbi:succinate dehydrogenase assembly factor 2 [Terramyces sp. JEL0728]|nr:succinate dehydrogenase assembly factor 2 [Terramyces sp. JEL0728]